MDEEYLKKVEEQKKLREEIARRKSERRQITYARVEETRPSTQPETRRTDRNRFNERPSDFDRRRRLDRPERDLPSRQPSRVHREVDEPRHRDREYTRDRSKLREEKTDLRDFARDRDTRQRMTSPGLVHINPQRLQQRMDDKAAAKSLIMKTTKQETTDSSEMKKAKLKAYLAVVVSNVKQLENPYKRISLLASSVGPTKVSRFCLSFFNLFLPLILLMDSAFI